MILFGLTDSALIALKICLRHLCQVEKLIDLILIGGIFNVLSFSNWLEAGVSMYLVHMSVSLLTNVIGIRALRSLLLGAHINFIFLPYLIFRRVANTGYVH
jgi:hypothetical protein